MKQKIAYLKGLMDGMKLPDDDNAKLLRAIAECLDTMADEIESESARIDLIEGDMDEINDDLDELDELVGFLIEDEEECCGECCDDEDSERRRGQAGIHEGGKQGDTEREEFHHRIQRGQPDLYRG